MKSLLVVIFCALSLLALGQIPNGGFENWTNLEPYTHPESEYSFTSVNEGVFYSTGELSISETEGVNGSALRLENLLINQDTVVGLAYFGEAPLGGELLFSNGITFPESVPDTVRLNLKYAINEDLEGGVFLQFFQAGELVTIGALQDSLFSYSLSGVQDVWNVLEIDLTELEFSSEPDECVIGFSSGDVFNRAGTPGDFLEIDYLELLSPIDTVLVSDFNLWSEVESPIEMDEWGSFFSPNSGYVFRSDNSLEGDYSLGLMSQVADTVVIQASAFLGESSNFGVSPNQPLPEDAFMLKFNYQFETLGLAQDSARVSILLAEDNDPETFDVNRKTQILYETNEWTEVSLEFGSIVDSSSFYGIEFFSGPQFPGLASDSSILLIDEVEILNIQNCGLNLNLSNEEDSYCIAEEINFQAPISDSYLWFIKRPEDVNYNTFSTESEFSISPEQSGSYSYFLIAEQDGCYQSSDTLDFSVITLEIPQLVINGTENASMCANENVDLMVSNASDFTEFMWFLEEELVTTTESGFLEIAGEEDFTGTYTALAQSAACPEQFVESNLVNLTTYPQNLPEISQNGNTLSTQLYSSYQWFYMGEQIPGAISQFHNPLEDGSYMVLAIDEFGCEFFSQEYFYSEVGVVEYQKEDILIYPNPVSSVLNISFNYSPKIVEIFNAEGQKVLSVREHGSKKLSLQLAEFPAGLYQILIDSQLKSKFVLE